MTEYPYTTRPEDVTRLLKLMPDIGVPAGKIDSLYIKSLGFSPKSSEYLFNIFKRLGFINEKNVASTAWTAYAADERRGLLLASAIKAAYANLFKLVFCPYLEGDDVILDFFRHEEVEGTARDKALMVATFRHLNELADFQDIMCEDGPGRAVPPPASTNVQEVKVNPNLQVNINIHIDPNTSDEKIETIFKNMQKYLLGKGK